MNGDKWVLIAAIAAGVFLVLRAANAGKNNNARTSQTTTGETVIFQEKDGRIYDQFGGQWT